MRAPGAQKAGAAALAADVDAARRAGRRRAVVELHRRREALDAEISKRMRVRGWGRGGARRGASAAAP
jgi:hypothetical protein